MQKECLFLLHYYFPMEDSSESFSNFGLSDPVSTVWAFHKVISTFAHYVLMTFLPSNFMSQVISTHELFGFMSRRPSNFSILCYMTFDICVKSHSDLLTFCTSDIFGLFDAMSFQLFDSFPKEILTFGHVVQMSIDLWIFNSMSFRLTDSF